MIQPEYLTPRVQQHLQDVTATMALYIASFVSSIMIGLTFDPSWWGVMMIFSLIGSIGAAVGTIASSGNKRWISCGVPIFLGLGTVPMIAITSLIDEAIIIYSGIGTVLIFLVLHLHAVKAPVGQYSNMGGLLYSSLTTLIYVSIFSMIFSLDMLETFELIAGLLLFCGFIAYDTNMMVTRAYHCEFTEEQREMIIIFDAMNLFLDAVNLFVRLMRLFMKLAKNKPKRN